MFGILHKLENGYMLTVNEIIKAGSNDSDKFEYKISNKNCDEIFKLVDVEKLADEEYDNVEDYDGHYGHAGFIKGFNKAMELNKDKLFGVKEVVELCKILLSNPFEKCGKTYQELTDNYIQSLQQPIEIEVDVRCYIGNGDKESDSFKDPLVTNTGIPKLDENGCLILKKK
jgi:hypothetical protein